MSFKVKYVLIFFICPLRYGFNFTLHLLCNFESICFITGDSNKQDGATESEISNCWLIRVF